MDYTRWVNVQGQIIDIKSMSDDYILNCINMIQNSSQKNGSTISKEWVEKYGVKYLKQFKIELAARDELRSIRKLMQN